MPYADYNKTLTHSNNYYKLNKECILSKSLSAANRKRKRELGRSYYANNKELIQQRKKKRYKGVTPDIRQRSRINKIQALYNVSREEALVLYETKVCAICAAQQPETRQFAVDHNHKTGKVRGKLCQNCNTGLANFKENPELFLKAIVYLRDNG